MALLQNHNRNLRVDGFSLFHVFYAREEIQEGEDGLLSATTSELQYKAKRRKYELRIS